MIEGSRNEIAKVTSSFQRSSGVRSIIFVYSQHQGLTFHDLSYEATSKPFEKDLNLMKVAAITGAQDVAEAQAVHASQAGGLGGAGWGN